MAIIFIIGIRGVTLIVIVAICVLIISLLLSRLSIIVEYKRHNFKDRLEIKISYFKVIKHIFHLSIINISKADKEYGFEILSNLNKQQEVFIDFKTIYKKLKQIRFYYKIYKSMIDKLLRFLKNDIRIKEVSTNIDVGLKDNALTGIAVGVMYAIFGKIFAAIFGNTKVKRYELFVNPNFKELLLKVHFSCIFTITLGNIIYVGLYSLFIYIVNYFNIINDNLKKTNAKKVV